MSHAASLPRTLWWLAALHYVASFLHFAHNAEFLHDYPNLPAWLSRGTVYAAWLSRGTVYAAWFATAVPGVAAIAAARAGWRATALLLLAVFGALGLYGFAHYAMAPQSAHTAAMNATIWGEAVTGSVLAACALVCLVRRR